MFGDETRDHSSPVDNDGGRISRNDDAYGLNGPQDDHTESIIIGLYDSTQPLGDAQDTGGDTPGSYAKADSRSGLSLDADGKGMHPAG